MKLLLDTHLLLWAAGNPSRLAPSAIALIENPDNELLFSAVSIWEVAIKSAWGGRIFEWMPACSEEACWTMATKSSPFSENMLLQ